MDREPSVHCVPCQFYIDSYVAQNCHLLNSSGNLQANRLKSGLGRVHLGGCVRLLSENIMSERASDIDDTPSDGVSAISEKRGTNRAIGEPVPNARMTSSQETHDRVTAVMRSAANEGLTGAKDGRIAGRISAELIATAKARTGLRSDTELLEFALANVALQDDFAQIFREVKGTVDAELDLEF